MPVLKIYFSRFEKMTGLPRKTIVDRLPFIGLDIEGEEADAIRVEYSPNRPDFSSDYGIARALLGLVGEEVGPPEYAVRKGTMKVKVSANLSKVRPYIVCAAARGLKMDDETIRQLISMQEDLHNGLARKRRKAAIGLHNLDAVKPPFEYAGVSASFEFVPLGLAKKLTIERILAETETGIKYGPILEKAPVYPIFSDSTGIVLSFPPIINGTATKVDTSTKNLLVDVTSTELKVAEDILAIICAALSDAGATLESLEVDHTDGKKFTPQLEPTKMKLDERIVTLTLGLELTHAKIAECLQRSRFGLDASGNAVIPRYRSDILHPVDLAEEVMIGYGFDKIEATYPPSREPGKFSHVSVVLDKVSESMAMAGFIETMNFDLTDVTTLYTLFSRPSEPRTEVDNPRSMDHSVLRDSLLPSLMATLARNVKSSYPQRVYETGSIFERRSDEVIESLRLCALDAHSSASYSEAKTYLESLISTYLGHSAQTRPASHWAFAEGRTAEVLVNGRTLGYLGEVKPSAVAAFGLDVPVAGYEIDLEPFL